jgi:hypothetical protein
MPSGGWLPRAQVNEVVLCARQVQCTLPVPPECPPSFRSDLLNLVWRLVVEFTLAPPQQQQGQQQQGQQQQQHAPLRWALPLCVLSDLCAGGGGGYSAAAVAPPQQVWPQDVPRRVPLQPQR